MVGGDAEVKGPSARACEQQENTGQELGILGADFVQDGPHTCFGRGGWKRKWAGTEIQRDLGTEDGNDHLEDKIEGGQAGEQTEQEQETAEDLADCDEMGCGFRNREPEFGKPTHSLIGIDEFEYAFPKEYGACHPSNDQNVGWAGDRRC